MKKAIKSTCRAFSLAFCLSGGLALTMPATSLAEKPTSIESAGNELRVSINTADAEALSTQLVGIGQTKAERIVAWREANGRFIKVEQLLEVKGIGEATLKKNLNRLAL